MLPSELRVFSTISDALLFQEIRNCQELSEPKAVRVRQAGGNPLLVRPGTTDHQVLWDTFYHKYHLPPVKLRPDCTIVDLGANVGYTVAHFAFLYPQARIIAVEMDSDNIKLAIRNTRFFQPRCVLIHAAVWPTNGQVAYEACGEWGFHVVGEEADRSSNTKMAPARTLDGILEEYKLETVDYLKMDIEGAEANVLQCSMKWINRVKSMKVEVHPIFNPAATIENCSNLLVSSGFNCKKDDLHPRCIVAIR